MSQDPYTDQSSQPLNPYQRGAPQNPCQYGILQDSYETSQDPYTTTPPYGYGQQQQSYDYSPPQAQATLGTRLKMENNRDSRTRNPRNIIAKGVSLCLKIHTQIKVVSR